MSEHRGKPSDYVAPSEAELSARRKRSIALALGLLGFSVFVFLTMISRGQAG